MNDYKIAHVMEIVGQKVKVRFTEDQSPSTLLYTKLSSYMPSLGDTVLMLRTSTSYICLGGIAAEIDDTPVLQLYLVGEYKMLAMDKGDNWQGWLKCDGRNVSRKAYPELFGEIGTAFGEGDGVTTFLLPDLRERILVHAGDESYGAAIGADIAVITQENLPTHGHEITDTGHTHVLRLWERKEIKYTSGNSSAYVYNSVTDTKRTDSGKTGISVQNLYGGRKPIDIRQPTLYGGYYYIYSGKEG